MKLIGVDVGGTFTDLVLVETDSGEMVVHKTPTTPHDPSEGVLTGVNQLCALASVAPEAVDHVLHGTTTATNAVLEYDGAVTGLITNEGYRDVLHIGRHQRPDDTGMAVLGGHEQRREAQAEGRQSGAETSGVHVTPRVGSARCSTPPDIGGGVGPRASSNIPTKTPSFS